jgi:protein ImuA
MKPIVTLGREPSEIGAESLGLSRSRTEIVEELRRILPRLEGFAAARPAFSFGISEIDEHLPQGGLAAGALHEIVPEREGDLPAAFAFLAALIGRLTQELPLLIVHTRRGLAEQGEPYGHGLNALGLDPARLILVEAADEMQALWAIEEALRSAVPAAVAGVTGKDPDLKTSRRLQLAAGGSGVPLFLLHPGLMTGASAAATRWRVGATAAAKDSFGLYAGARWRLRLERCRNGRPGEWLVELDHVAYRFSLAAEMADPALPRGARAQSGAQGG